jgi:UDP-glucose:(heptosyl)LPS alpha-1,3-glucosyltransferase
MNGSIVFFKSLLSRNGGAEKYTWRLARAFKEKNSDVTILTSGPPSQNREGIQLVSCPERAPFSFLATRQFDHFCSAYVEKYKPSLIFGLDRNRFQTHLRASNGVHAAYLKQRQLSEPLWKQISHKINPLHHTLLKIEKESFEHPELEILFTNSFMVREEILRTYRTDPKKIQVIHNGVEWQELSSDFTRWQKERQEVCKRLGLRPDTYHFLFIGNNYRRKGLEPLLRGLSLLPHRHFHLSVIGRDQQTDLFRAQIKRERLESVVTFFGPRTDTRSFYQVADCLVVPSFYDPFANVTVEALAMGLFVVSSRSNGGHEVLNSDNGKVIEDLFNRESLCASLECALRHPKTWESSLRIRHSVAHLDFSTQLALFLKACGYP